MAESLRLGPSARFGAEDDGILGVMEEKQPLTLLRSNVWLTVGLGALWFSLMVSPYYPVSLSTRLALNDLPVVSGLHTVYALALMGFFAVLVAGRNRIGVRSKRRLILAAALCGLVGCGAFLLAPPSGFPVPLLEFAAVVLVAAYVATFFSLWLSLLGRLQARDGVLLLSASFVGFSALWALLICLGRDAAALVSAFCPAVSLLCLLRCSADEVLDRTDEGDETLLKPLPWGVVVLCGAFIYFGVLAVRVFTTMGFGMGTVGLPGFAASLITALSGLAIVGFLGALFYRRGLTLSNVVSAVALLALVYMASLLVITLADPSGLPVLVAKRVLVAGEHSAEVLLLMALVGEVSRRRSTGLFVFGLYGALVCALPQLLSQDVLLATGLLGVVSESPYVSPVAAVGAFCIAAAAIVMLVAYSRGTAAEATVSGDRWQQELCRRATASYDITPRELDVVVYTYRGYSAKKIAETLLVSESTVKAHLAHSYRKLGVHTKQELISLVDGYREH